MKAITMWAITGQLQLVQVEAYLASKIGSVTWYYAPQLGYALPEHSGIFLGENIARRELLRRLKARRDQIEARIKWEEAQLG